MKIFSVVFLALSLVLGAIPTTQLTEYEKKEFSQASYTAESPLLEAPDKPALTQKVTWDVDSPFGKAIEQAATALYQIYNNQEYASMYYTVGLADYTLDGMPELFIGCLGGNRSSSYYVFEISAENYRLLGSYPVASGGQRFDIVKDQRTGKQHLMVTSTGGNALEYIFTSTFFDYYNGEFNVWHLRQEIIFNQNGKAYGPGSSVFLNDAEINGPLALEEANRNWFDKDWHHNASNILPIPAVELNKKDWDWRCTKDPEVTKAQIYLLANTYMQLKTAATS